MRVSTTQNRSQRALGSLLAIAVLIAIIPGCVDLGSAHTWSRDYGLKPMPGDDSSADPCLPYDERVDGGTLYKQHCSRCHNGRPLSERSFAQNEVSLAHMRNFSGLTGNEYRKILHYMRRWHGVGPPTPDVEPSPKRLFFEDPDRQDMTQTLPDEESR